MNKAELSATTVAEAEVPDKILLDQLQTQTSPDPDSGPTQNSIVNGSTEANTQKNFDEKKERSKYRKVSSAHKLGFLIWKNFQTLKCHKLQTLFEILLPVLFVSIVLVVRVLIKTSFVKESFSGKAVPYGPSRIAATYLDTKPIYLNLNTTYLYFSPDTTQATQIMEIVQRHYLAYGIADGMQIKRFSTEAKLEDAYSKSHGNVLGGIVFEKISQKTTQYKIRLSSVQKEVNSKTLIVFEVPRWHTESVYPNPQLRGIRQPRQIAGGTPGYSHQGFIYLQFAVDASIIKFFSPKTDIGVDRVDKFIVRLAKFTYPESADDRYLPIFISIFQIVIILSFLYPVNNIVKHIVVEKEKRLVESMKLMGIGPSLHWLAWLVNHFFFLVLTDVLMVFILKLKVQKNSVVIFNADASLLFVFLLAYISSIITFAFFLSTLFSKANAAVMTSWILFSLTYLPFIFLASQYENMGLVAKMLAMLFLNTAVAYGFQIILILDGFGPGGEGSHWSNIHSSAGTNDTLSLVHVIIMLFVDSVIYMLLAIYIEAVFPGQYGIPRPWYFLIQKSYWCRPALAPKNNKIKSHLSDASSGGTLKEIHYEGNSNFEKPADSLKAGIKIRDLTKTFGTKTVVNNLNIDILENQITVLLGHNGAGKTTTMSMLTGLFPPTSGTAIIHNVDIRKNMDHIQGNLRLCPQHDILFDELTCEQHLKLYCWVKGCVDVKGEVDAMLSALNLEPKRHTEASSLSGGMKRKLSVGMALIGGSPTVMFDEPTAGMDPAARRIVWDLLASEKQRRTIILSTHFMDEADLLGDRIAVLAGGKLQAVGTSLFLKELYGDGYQLVIVKQRGCDVSKISDLLRRHLGDNVEIANNVGAELSYSMPKEMSPLFSNLFDELEERRVELLIDSYGATVTTMEEVFMRITKGVTTKKLVLPATEGDSRKPSSKPGSTAGVFISYNQVKPALNDVFTTQYNCSTGFALDCQQFRASLVKKWLYVSRSWALIIIQVVIPVVLVLGMYITVKTSSVSEQNIRLSLEKFKNTITPMLCRRSDSLCDAYQSYAKQFTVVIKAKMALPDFNISEYILAESKKSLLNVNSRFIIAFEQKIYLNVNQNLKNRNQTRYVAHYNNQPYHAQPVTLNFLTNAILRLITGDNEKEIIVFNHPLPISAHDKALFTKGTEILIFILGMTIMFGISFVVASIVIFLVRERAGKAKHLQRVSGLKMTVYWLANFAFDSTTYLVTVALILVVIVSFALDPYSEREVYVGIFLLLVAFGWAAIPIVYISSFLFSLPATGFTKLAVSSIFLGIGPYVTMVIVNIPEFKADKLAELLQSIFIYLPIFSMGYGIYELGFNRNLHLECPELFVVIPKTVFCAPNTLNDNNPHACCIHDVPYFAWHPFGIGQNLVTLFVTGLVAIFILILIEAKLFQKIQDSRARAKAETLNLNNTTNNKLEDADVEAETYRIQTSNEVELFQSENLVLKNLSKYFVTFKAVDSLNLGVQKGECFGLLGVNGAGKTTTFRILTGDLSPSSGDAFVVGHSVRKDLKYIHKKVGYCPQFDALIDELTGRETIRLFARLRGISENKINDVANRLGEVLVFSEFLDRPAGTYSGGNQRKLSTAIALVGNPPLVFLDEPSNGMDPVARRHLWDCLSKVRESGASIILTSHSMEECEALCTRLVIMVSGRFRCLGSIQHLKSKFSEGFTVTAQLQTQTASNLGNSDKLTSKSDKISFEWETEIKPLQQFIETSFPDSVLKDAHASYVHYQVRNPSLTWGYLFQKMEKAKMLFALEAYSVGQTSMDQIFLLFGKNHDSDE